MSDSYDGGASAPFGSQHLDDGLPRPPSLRMPGGGDVDAQAAYMLGRQEHGSPVGGADAGANRETQKMFRHGVRQARRQSGKEAKEQVKQIGKRR